MKKFALLALLFASLCIVGCGDKKTTGVATSQSAGTTKTTNP